MSPIAGRQKKLYDNNIYSRAIRCRKIAARYAPLRCMQNPLKKENGNDLYDGTAGRPGLGSFGAAGTAVLHPGAGARGTEIRLGLADPGRDPQTGGRPVQGSSWLTRCNQEKKGKAQSRRNRRLYQEIFVE